jgi:hypothetical protein
MEKRPTNPPINCVQEMSQCETAFAEGTAFRDAALPLAFY